MTSEKISCITTVLNEGKTIEVFLESLARQSKNPDEIIIVDGGSTDETFRKSKKFISTFNPRIKIKLLKKTGNRSAGRNFAIKNANGEIIVATDAGCILDKNWIKNISEPFHDKNVDVVGGFYKAKTESVFEECLATYTSTMPDKIDSKNFLPSSRSIAFRKFAWEKVRGYPEDLDTCEDLIFDKRLKTAGFNFKFVKNAFVWWPQRKNIISAAKQFFQYAKGDGKALYVRPNTPYLFLRYIFGIIFLLWVIEQKNLALYCIPIVLILLYITWSISKNYKYVKKPTAFLYLPLLQFTSDFAVIVGFVVGFIARF